MLDKAGLLCKHQRHTERYVIHQASPRRLSSKSATQATHLRAEYWHSFARVPAATAWVLRDEGASGRDAVHEVVARP